MTEIEEVRISEEEILKQEEKKKRNAAEVAAAIELIKKRGPKIVQKQGTIFKPLSKAQTDAVKKKKGR